jgi:hypothetical protein
MEIPLYWSKSYFPGQNLTKIWPKKDATTACKVPALLLYELQLCIILGVCYSSKDLKEGDIES